MRRISVWLLLIASAVYGQQKTEDDTLVTVPKKYVSSQGLEHQSATEQTSKWVGIGREIGIATREGLNGVVDVSQKFGSTNVGHFVMFMVAWKIIGRDILGIVIGIPALAVGLCVWIWSFKRFFFGYRRLTMKDGKGGKTWDYAPPYKFDSDDARTGCAWAHVIVALALLISLIAIVV